MVPDSSDHREVVAWVRDVNSRWIVHHGLKEHAEAYLAHLEASDPERLNAACDRAARLIHACEPVEDPKPWFYAGLFSVATVQEAEHYLADHWFTTQCIAPSLAGRSRSSATTAEVGSDTEDKIARIRQALSELD